MRPTVLAIAFCGVLPATASADHEMQIIFDEAQYVLTCVSPMDLSYIMKGYKDGLETARARRDEKLNEVVQDKFRACGYLTNQSGEYRKVEGLIVQLVQELGVVQNSSGEVSMDLYQIAAPGGNFLFMVISSPIVDGKYTPGYDLITRTIGFDPPK